uniref:Uncharacterized protein n=1 Tax=Anguilla anguilla TaxID=7936 RepID=A0A0E9XX25_ANGAN
MGKPLSQHLCPDQLVIPLNATKSPHIECSR